MTSASSILIKLVRITSIALVLLFISVTATNAATHTITPNNSIIEAIKNASPGDTILLDDGTYYLHKEYENDLNQNRLEIDKPLVLKAKNPGKAIVSGSYPNQLQFTQDSATQGLYWINVPRVFDSRSGVLEPIRPKNVIHDDELLLDYVSLDNLKAFAFDSNTDRPIPGPKYGYYYDSSSNRLYVRLKNARNPNDEEVEITGASYRQHNNGIYIYSSNVTVEGLIFRNWGERSIFVDDRYGALNLENISIKHNYFFGFSVAIYVEHNVSNVRIEHNEFSNFPFYQYRIDGDSALWSKMYGRKRPVHLDNLGNIVRYNYLYESFDGILVRGDSDKINGNNKSDEFAFNLISNIVDNPLEIEPINRYWTGRVHHNFFLDNYSLNSLTSMQFGHALIDHNIYYNSPEYGICNPNRWLKFGSNNGADPNEPYGPITIVHNTAVLCDEDNNENSSSLYSGGEDLIFEDTIVQNNIILVKTLPYSRFAIDSITLANENIIYGSNITESTDFGDADPLVTDPEFMLISPKIDFHLSAASPAIGAGFNKDSQYHHVSRGATDLGAIEYGDTWTLPKVGPSWANYTNIPNRPPVPSSVSSAWLGLDPNASTPGPSDDPQTPTAIPTTPGDADQDGDVDGIDYIVWLNNYNKPTANGQTDGDFDGNGFVDGLDYIIWLNNYSG